MVKIQKQSIFLKNINDFEEIILVGSGKGISSVSGIENSSWKRKSIQIYKKLSHLYYKEINRTPIFT